MEYENVVKAPFIALAVKLKSELISLAPDYHFPSKGLGRIKRPAFKVAAGMPLYKDWLSYIASKPAASRFESQPHLFFGLFPNEKDRILVACGLWRPSSRQTRLIREAISKDSEPFKKLFKSKNFKARFPNGFSMDEVSARTPRGFPDQHKDIHWIKLKNFIVMRKLTVPQLSSKTFSDELAEDLKQGLKLNRLLEKAIAMQWTST